MLNSIRYDFGAFAAVEFETNFDSVKDAVVKQFCVAEYNDLFQRLFLGCCTATIIQNAGEFCSLIIPFQCCPLEVVASYTWCY